jgi:hypothetical protein
VVEQVGTSQTLGWLPTGYTYYKALATITWSGAAPISVLAIPAIPVFAGVVGGAHNEGLVPDPGFLSGAAFRLLREDASWRDVGATSTPQPVGTAAVGTSNLYARQDHVHARGASWLLVASGSFPAAATLTVAIPAGYSDLQITFTGASSNTATREFQIRFSTDSGATYDSTAANYPGFQFVATATVSATTRATAFQMGPQAAADTNDGTIVVSGYAMLTAKLITAAGVGSTIGGRSQLGRYLPALAITNIQFGWDASGNFDAGTYTVSVK